MAYPVVMFVYARPEHTQRTIEALSQNYLAKETDLYIYADAPKNDQVRSKVEKVREIVDSVSSQNRFKSVHVIKALKNKGLARSVIDGVTEVLIRQKKVIVLEDDLLTSRDFLLYMNTYLDFYEHDKDIWSISGYTFNLKIPKGYSYETYLSYRGCSWGWATWLDRWEMIDWDVTDYPNFKSSTHLRRQFNRGGNDLSVVLDMQMSGEIDSWAIRWVYSQFKNRMLTVYPIHSKVVNIGLDGTGTHNSLLTKYVSSRYKTSFHHESKVFELEKPPLNDQIVRNFRKTYGSSLTIMLKRYVKKMLKKCAS